MFCTLIVLHMESWNYFLGWEGKRGGGESVRNLRKWTPSWWIFFFVRLTQKEEENGVIFLLFGRETFSQLTTLCTNGVLLGEDAAAGKCVDQVGERSGGWLTLSWWWEKMFRRIWGWFWAQTALFPISPLFPILLALCTYAEEQPDEGAATSCLDTSLPSDFYQRHSFIIHEIFHK